MTRRTIVLLALCSGCLGAPAGQVRSHSRGGWTLGVAADNGAIVSLKWKGAELVSNPGARQTVGLNCSVRPPERPPRATDGEAHGIVETDPGPTVDAPLRLVASDFCPTSGVLTLNYASGCWRVTERIVLGDGRANRLSRTVSFGQTTDAPLKFRGVCLSLPLRLRGSYYLPGGFFTDLVWREDNRASPPRLDWSRRRGRLADFRRGGNDRVKFAFFDPVSNLTVMAFCDSRMDGTSLACRKGTDSFAVDWRIGAQGWCEPGQTQTVQKQWLEIAETDPERCLDERAPRLLTDLGLTPPATRPDWVRDAAIFGIETEPFRGERLADIPRVIGPRMRQLGLNTCWYRPVQTATARYCPIDYRVIEPKIGSAEDYRRANEGLHGQGIRVLQDLVPHGGGQLGFYLRGQSCSMQGMTENGDVLDMWSADFADPRWLAYMRETSAVYTGDWKADGFRVDAIYGTKTLRNWRRRGWPGEPPQTVPSHDWNRRTGRRIHEEYWRQSLKVDGGALPALAYDRASLASSWGGLRMVEALRAGAAAGCRDAALLLECGELPFVAAGDLTYDRDIQSLWFKLRALQPEEFVLGLRTWLHEQQKVDPPGAVRMRYMETGDGESWPYRNWYGLAADRAIRALCAFIDGVPMFFENFTKGEGDSIAMLMRIRREVKSLRRGAADYRSFPATEPGVFAFTRTCEGSRAVVAINFSPAARRFRDAVLTPWGFAVWENGRRVDDTFRDPRLTAAAAGSASAGGELVPQVVQTEDGEEYRFPTAVRWELDTAEGLLADTMPENPTPRASHVADYGGKRPSVRRDQAVIWSGAENPAAGCLRVTDGTRVCALPIDGDGHNDRLLRDRGGQTCLTYVKGRGIPSRDDGVPTGVVLLNESTHWVVSNGCQTIRLLRANGVPAGTDLEADRRLAGGGPYAVASGDPDSRVRIERVGGRLVLTFRGEIRSPYAPGPNRLYLETRYTFDRSERVSVEYALTPSGTAPVKPSVSFVAGDARHDFFAHVKEPLVPRRTYRFGYVLAGGKRTWLDCEAAKATDEGYPLRMTGENATWIDRGADGEKVVRMAWCNPSVRLEVSPGEFAPGRYTLSFDARGERLEDPAVRAWSEKVSPFQPFLRECVRLTATLRYFTTKGERKSVSVGRQLPKEFAWRHFDIDFELPEGGWAPQVEVSLCNAYSDVTFLTRLRFSSRWHDGEDETASLQRRIDETSAAGGGRVTLAAGEHRIRPIQLKRGVELHLEADARLLGSPFGGDYPDRPLRHAESTVCPRGRSSALIWADEADGIALTGPGTLDGNGAAFLRPADEYERTWGFRWKRRYGLADSPPRLCLFTGCRGVRVEGLRVGGLPGGWAFWVHDCDDVLFDGVGIRADVNCANNDGIHVNCSRDVTIRNCDVVTGDDAIVVRANSRSLKENRVCARVVVSNCTLRSWSCGVRLGWCNDGTIRDCLFEDLRMNDTTFGIGIVLPPKRCIPSDYGREATLIENLAFRKIRLDGIYAHPLYCRISNDPLTRCTAVRNLLFEDVTGYGLQDSYFEGTAAHPFENFHFRNCRWRKVDDSVLPDSAHHGAASRERFRREKFAHTRGFVTDGSWNVGEARTWDLNGNDSGIALDGKIPYRSDKGALRAVPCSEGFPASRKAFVDAKGSGGAKPDWRITLEQEGSSRPVTLFGARQNCVIDEPTPGVRRFVYDALTDGCQSRQVKVTVEEVKTASGTTFRGRVENNDPGIRVTAFEGPYFDRLRLDPNAAAFTIAQGFGRRITTFPTANAAKASGWTRLADGCFLFDTGFHPGAFGLSMPWAALETGETTCYLGAHDRRAQPKRLRLRWSPQERRAELCFDHRFFLSAGGAWEIPETVCERVEGDWHAAAKRYRAWYDTVREVRAATPAWTRAVAGWLLVIMRQQNGELIWPYTDIPKLCDVAERNGLDCIGLFGWTESGHDHNYPDYVPSAEAGGVAALKAGIAEAHRRGIRIYIYANGQLQQVGATDFWRRHGKNLALIKKDGSMVIQTYHKYADIPKYEFALGCLYGKAWGERMYALAEQAEGFGADGILYDQLGIFAPFACYGRGHGHPTPDYSYAVERPGFLRSIADRIQRKNAGFAVLTEGLHDTILDSIGIFHACQYGAFADEAASFRRKGRREAFPEMWRYTFPELVSTCRFPTPMVARTFANYAATYGFRQELEIRYAPDRRYALDGIVPQAKDYGTVKNLPDLAAMQAVPPAEARAYLKGVCDFQRRNAKYLLVGSFVDTDGFCQTNPAIVAKRFVAADGTSAICCWNASDAPAEPIFAGCEVRPADAPAGTSAKGPIPADSLRLYR